MTIVVLAAGSARRMGNPKLLLPVEGRPMIERVLAAAGEWPIVVVTGAAVAPTLGASTMQIVLNDAPERGMSHSLALGNAAVAADEPIAVLLADLPDITPDAIRRAIDGYDDSVDVVVPRCGETFAHPVVFGPLARRRIAALPDGDTIQRLRDDTTLRRRIVETDRCALTDIDTPDDYARRTGNPNRDASA